MVLTDSMKISFIVNIFCIAKLWLFLACLIMSSFPPTHPDAIPGCECTGVGMGQDALYAGLPLAYGTLCQSWWDGRCDTHPCGSRRQCDDIFPGQEGKWCCRTWCYVNPDTCKLPDVQASRKATKSSALFYSFQACQQRDRIRAPDISKRYSQAACPWQREI